MSSGSSFSHCADRHVHLELGRERRLEAGDVPLLLDRFRRHVDADRLLDQPGDHVADRVGDVGRLEQFVALLVDDAALVVRDVVVFEQLLADVEVARLDARLRLRDRAVDDRMLDRLALGHLELLHDRRRAARRRRCAAADPRATGRSASCPGRPAGPTRPRSWLSIRRDSCRSVPTMCSPPAATTASCRTCHSARSFAISRSLSSPAKRLVVAHLEDRRLEAAAQHDVGAATRHVGRDRDRLRPAGLRDDLGFARVLLRVQHLCGQPLLLEVLRQELRALDRRRADQHRLPALEAVLDVGDDRLDLLLERAEHLVVLVLADHRHVRRDDDRFQVIDLLELEGLGVRGAGHAGELAVHPEVVLERDRRERLVLALDRHAFLRLDRLMQAVGPAASGHQPAGELVDDDDLAVLHDVVLVAVEQRMRAQRRVQVVHQRDVVRVVQARACRRAARLPREFPRRARGPPRRAAPGVPFRRPSSRRRPFSSACRVSFGASSFSR